MFRCGDLALIHRDLDHRICRFHSPRRMTPSSSDSCHSVFTAFRRATNLCGSVCSPISFQNVTFTSLAVGGRDGLPLEQVVLYSVRCIVLTAPEIQLRLSSVKETMALISTGWLPRKRVSRWPGAGQSKPFLFVLASRLGSEAWPRQRSLTSSDPKGYKAMSWSPLA